MPSSDMLEDRYFIVIVQDKGTLGIICLNFFGFVKLLLYRKILILLFLAFVFICMW